MTNRRTQSLYAKLNKRRRARKNGEHPPTDRQLQLEGLEDRRVMAIGPQLAGIQPNNASLLSDGQVLNVAPRELVFRFSDGADIDPATLSGIRITRSGLDGQFSKAVVTTDFNTNGATIMDITGVDPGESSNGLRLVVIKNDLGSNPAPRITLLGDSINVELNTNSSGRTRARDLRDALNSHPQVGKLVQASIRSNTNASQDIATPAITYSPLILSGANAAVAVSGFNSGTPLQVKFTSVAPGPAGNGIRIVVTRNDFRGVSPPQISVNGRIINIVLNSNQGNQTTAQELVNTINAHPLASALVTASIPVGRGDTVIGSRPPLNTAIVLGGVNDVPIVPGFVGLGDTRREIIVRFKENLPDDLYHIEILGAGTNGIRDVNGGAFGDRTEDGVDNGVDAHIDFELDLGAQIEAIVPQPVNRNVALGSLEQARDEIHVYFNNDDLFPQPVRTGELTTNPTVVDPSFYELIFTRDTLTNSDDVSYRPTLINYDPGADVAVLTFADELDRLGSGGGTYRLRIGTDEPVPLPPVRANASADPGSSFATATSTGITLRISGTGSTIREGQTFTLTAESGASQQFEWDTGFVLQAGAGSTYDDGDTFTIANGARIVVFEVDRDGVVPAPNVGIPLVGNETAAAVGDKLVAAINPQNLGLTAVHLGAGLVQLGGTAAHVVNVPAGTNLTLSGRPGPQSNNATAIRYIPSATTTSTNLAALIATAVNQTSLGIQATADGSQVQLLNGKTFQPGNGLTGIESLGLSSLVLSAGIEAQPYGIQFSGANDEPGHREIPIESHLSSAPDNTDGITRFFYNFRSVYGADPSGNTLQNLITENQKQRAREIFELYANYLGVSFVETTGQGFTIATGDLRALNPDVVTGPGGVLGIAGGGVAIMDSAENWDDAFGQTDDPNKVSWFETALHEIGHLLGLGHNYELPPGTVMGSEPILSFGQSAEPVYPGDHDVTHGQFLYRPESKDIDLFRTVLPEAGKLSIETFAERLPNSSLLDTVLTVYREDETGKRTLIARNDDYFSSDSYVELDLTAGTYYIGVSASGNDNYDPVIEDTGFGGRSQGNYQVRLDFRPRADRSLVDATGTKFDGNSDGAPGGTFDFWFRVQDAAHTVYVDKATDTAGAGTLANPYANLGSALTAVSLLPGDVRRQMLVRVVGNGGADLNLATIQDNLAYEIGFNSLGNILTDGDSFDIPQGVSVAIDSGAIIKLRRAEISVGSTSSLVDRSGGSLQVYGTPRLLDVFGSVVRDINGNVIPGSVYFTSINDSTTGFDTNPTSIETDPRPGDWGGLSFRRIIDQADQNRFDQEREGIFLNSVNHANIRYGGGTVVVDGVPTVVTPIHMEDSRPTATYNQISLSSDAAISATPDSFAESNFHSPEFQRVPFTTDYDRVGPKVYGNTLVNNSINGMAIRVSTPAGDVLRPMTVSGRWDDIDVPHVLSETLVIQGTPGGPVQETSPPPVELVTLAAAATGKLAAGTYNYRVVFVDADGNEGAPSNPTRNLAINGEPNQGTIILGNLPTATSEFRSRRIYRSDNTGNTVGTYSLVAEINPIDSSFTDSGATIGGVLRVNTGVNRARLDARLAIDPGTIVKLGNGAIETSFGGQLLAEGVDGLKVIFTSSQDDTHGGSGSFDTTNNAAQIAAAAGDWGGLRIGHASKGSLDRVVVAHGGGTVRIEGDFAGFNPVEIVQADVRIANSEFRNNASGVGGIAGSERAGRGLNGPGTIFVRGAQPVILNNMAVTNAGPAISINANSLDAEMNVDPGRSTYTRGTSLTGHVLFVDAATGYGDNEGPLVRLNRLEQNDVNGMRIRGATLTNQSVWDDTDIVHVIQNENIVVPDFHTSGGLRLESSGTESLVVKLQGAAGSTGFITATGRPLDIDDRIGGMLHVIGQPNHPVVMTSIEDCTVGAGFTPLGEPQNDTVNSNACRDVGTAAGFADIVVLMDESGSMFFAQDFSRGLIRDLDAALIAAGIGDGRLGTNRFGLSGYGGGFVAHQLGHAHPVGPNGALFGTSAQYDIAAQTLVDTGALEDGYEGLQFVLDTYQFRPDAEKFIILVSNEDRDIEDPQLTFATTLAGLNAADIRLEGILSVNIVDQRNRTGLAIDADDVVFQENGTGGFTTSPNGRIIPFVFDTTVRDYADMVFATGGLVGDIDQIQQGGLTATSFSAAMVSQIVVQAGGGQRSRPGDWGGVRLEEFAHDRNVDVITESEVANTAPPGTNSNVNSAQPIGALAVNEKSGDENLRLGLQVHGTLSAPSDIDVYSFEARAGTEVWLDIDKTSFALDSVVELLDGGGRVLARSDNSRAESGNPALLFRGTNVPSQHVNPLTKSVFGTPDLGTTNPRDAGMRVVLPGPANTNTTYHVRVRSSSANLADVNGGLTSGPYQLQLRLREQDEYPGTTVRFSDIRFATNGIEIQGQPAHSPLTGEASEPLNAQGNDNNNTQQTAVPLGNVLSTDRGTLSIAGNVNLPNDVDWYTFRVEYDSVQGSIATTHASLIFDLDYADGMARSNSNIWIFDSNGNLILRGGDSNVASDRPAPLAGANVDDLSRGSVGPLDAYVGPVELPAVGTAPGVYFVAVGSNAVIPAEMQQFVSAVPSNPFVRLEPINSLTRISEDQVGTSGLSNISGPPQVPILFDNSSRVPFTLSDVDLFVIQDSGVDQSRLNIVDPFTGEPQNVVGITTQNYNDVAMHPVQGVLYGYNAREFQPTDANNGTLATIDPRSTNTTALQTVIGDDTIETNNEDPMNPGQAIRSNNGNGFGVSFNAIGIGPILRPTGLAGYAIGNRADANFPPLGVARTRNLLYEFNLGTGVAFSNNPPGDRGTQQNPITQGAWTQINERGSLDTANDPFGPGNTVALAAEATIVTPTTTVFNITDGQATGATPTTFVVDDGAGQTFRFEFNAGPEARVVHSPSTGISIRDGDRILLDGAPYEFDTGSVIVVTASGANIQDGDTITITDEPPFDPMNPRGPITRTFEFDRQGGLNNNNNIAIPFSLGDNNPQIIAAIVNAINSAQFAVSAVANLTRITLLNESNTVRAVENAGGPTVSIEGAPGVGGGAVRIRVEESFDLTTFGTAIDVAINSTPDASFEGNRINFSGAITADFSQVTNQSIFTNLQSNGNVTAGNIAVNFLAADDANSVADRMVAAINQNTPVRAVRSGPGVQLQGNAFFANADLPIRLGGTAPGGDIQGMAFLGSRMFAVSDAGGLYEVLFPQSNFAIADYRETATELLTAGRDAAGNPGPIRFAGLAAGPDNLEGGRFRNLLFGIDRGGRLYAFDTNGALQPVFANGQTSIETGLANVTGLAFSNLDFNLWHASLRRRTDQGHGVDPAFDGSRLAEVRAGNQSLYFGFEGRAENGVTFDQFSDPGVANTYDFPGGAHGSLISNPFSLKGYAAEDGPMLYFNYFLNTENSNALITEEPGMRDSFRVYVSGNDGEWNLVATNNSDRGIGLFDDEFDDQTPFDGDPSTVQELFDIGDNGAPTAWRQARIPLGSVAGQENVRLRFEFNTAGESDFGDDGNTGSELRALPARQLRDGQSFTLLTQDALGNTVQRTFELDFGYTILAPTGAAIPDGSFITIDSRAYEFDSNNTLSDPTRVQVPYRLGMSATEVGIALQRAILTNPPPPPVFTGVLTNEPNDVLSGALATGLTGRSGVFQSSGAIGDNLNLVVDPSLDVDLMRLNLQANDRLIVDIDTNQVGQALDSFVRVFDANGNQLAFNNNGAAPSEGLGNDSYLEFIATTTGVFYVGVSGNPNSIYNPIVEGSGISGATGGYDITITVEDSFGTVRRDGNRLNLPNAGQITSSNLPNSVLEGVPGVGPQNLAAVLHSSMTADEVANELATTIAGGIGNGVRQPNQTYEDFVRLVGMRLFTQDRGPLQGQLFGFANTLFGDAFGEHEASTLPDGRIVQGFPGVLRARDNAFEGVYIDDIIVGFAERGEMVIGAQASNAFVNNPEHIDEEIDVGTYQLEVRRGPDYGTSDPLPQPTLLLRQPFGRSFDTNDPLTSTVELIAPAGSNISEGQTFALSDGVNRITFEFDDLLINNGVTAGRARIPFLSSESDVQIAGRIRTAINSVTSQAVVKITAATDDGAVTGSSTSNRLLLYGNAILEIQSTALQVLTADLRGSEANDILNGAVNTGLLAGGIEIFRASGSIGDNAGLATSSLDVDMLRLALGIGERITIDTDTTFGPGGRPDTVLRVFDATGQQLAVSDDRAAPDEPISTLDSFIDFTAPADGVYYIGISSFANFFYNPNLQGSGQGAFSVGDYTIEILRPDNSASGFAANVIESFGDSNTVRDQGQLIIQGNKITQSSGFGILADAGSRSVSDVSSLAGNLPHAGAVRNTREVNSQRLVPGVVIANNLLTSNSGGGVRFSGDAGTGMLGPIPYGRIVNNTIVGPGAVGIQVDENASPTLLNNILANLSAGLTIDASSNTTVVGGSVFQNAPSTVTGSNAISLSATEPLFLDALKRNFYLAPGARAIDNSIDSLQDRPALTTVKSPLGLGVSPILAPNRDVLGQKRVDDPSVSTPPGSGLSVFKDRGAIDRADFAGPSAVLLNPRDNDSLRFDTDGREAYLQLTNVVMDNFSIQLLDGVEPTDPANGVGADDTTVRGNRISVLRDGQKLLEGIDYRFRYDATNNIIRLTPLAGIWELDHVYEITLSNSEGFALTAPNGAAVTDGLQFSLTDKRGQAVTFEYDSGYTIRVPATFALQIPANGGAGLRDGDTFSISDGTRNVIFEFDSNGAFSQGNTVITFNAGQSANDIANALVTIIQNARLGLAPVNIVNSVGRAVHLGSRANHTVNVATSTLTLTGQSSNVVDAQTFTIDDGTKLVTFEFNSTGGVRTGNVAIDFTPSHTHEQIADLIVAAVRQSGTGLNPTHEPNSNGQVHLGGTSHHVVDVSGTGLTISGLPGVRPAWGLRIPTRGGRVNGIIDGETFSVSNGTTSRTFEFDRDNRTTAGNLPIVFTATTTPDQLANLVAIAIRNANLGLSPSNTGFGVVTLGGTTNHAVDVTNSRLIQIGSPGVDAAVAINFVPGTTYTPGVPVLTPQFSEAEMAVAIASAINAASNANRLQGVGATAKDGEVLVSGLQSASGIPNVASLSINDLAGNRLKANQSNGETRFVIQLGSGFDFGDAPSPFPTLEANNGARHTVVTGFQLGTLADAEVDGQPSASSTGDDLSASSDEDGVTFGTLSQGYGGTITVNASKAGLLDAWIDFNGDGDWNDVGERIADHVSLTGGNNVLNVAVPGDARLADTFARFRLSSAGVNGPTGEAPDGEVEDYRLKACTTRTDASCILVGNPWRNPVNHLNVDNDAANGVSPIDALLIFNEINRNGSRPLPGAPVPPFAPPPIGQAPFLDTNGDTVVSALDALLVINFLNSRVGAEGEAAAYSLAASSDLVVGAAFDDHQFSSVDGMAVRNLAVLSVVAGDSQAAQVAAIAAISPDSSDDWLDEIVDDLRGAGMEDSVDALFSGLSE